jgi:hypothetical protein
MRTIILITVIVCVSLARGALLDRAELLQAVSGSGDIVEWATKNGLNLPKVVENCLDHTNPKDQVRAWKLLVYFIDTYGADGAAGEELSTVGPSLSKLIDDATLLRIISRIPEEHWHDGIPFSLVWRFNYRTLSDTAKVELQKAHPIAVRAIESELEKMRSRRIRRAEQGGVGQPATALESKQKGD